MFATEIYQLRRQKLVQQVSNGLILLLGNSDSPFNSTDNPFIPPEEIEAARKTMSTMSFRQEFEASFETFSGGIFKEEWFKTSEEPEQGNLVWIIVLGIIVILAIIGFILYKKKK